MVILTMMVYQIGRVTIDNEPTMIFDRNCEVRNNYDHALFALFEEALPPFSLAELFQQDIQH